MTNPSVFSFIKFVVLAILLSACNPSSSIEAQSDKLVGDWQGSLNVQGQSLPLVIHLTNTESSQTGSLDTPSQGGYGIPMTKLVFNNQKLLFEIKDLGIHYEGKLNSKNNLIEGTIIQGQPFKLNFSRVEKFSIEKSTSSNSTDVLGTWNGFIPIQPNPLPFVIHVKEDGEGGLKATTDSPDQNSYDYPVSTVNFENGTFKFSIKDLNAEYEGVLLKNASEIQGRFKQRGSEFQLNLRPGAFEKK